MKEINLRDYYPFYTTDTIVEVPDEVADLLYQYKLNEAAYILRTYRHKAYFSLGEVPAVLASSGKAAAQAGL